MVMVMVGTVGSGCGWTVFMFPVTVEKVPVPESF
jgi:hypothetical protein